MNEHLYLCRRYDHALFRDGARGYAALSAREDRELLDIGEASAQRGADLVQQILAFARGPESPRVRLALRRILRDLEKLVRPAMRRACIRCCSTFA